jgi:hypothetical protein
VDRVTPPKGTRPWVPGVGAPWHRALAALHVSPGAQPPRRHPPLQQQPYDQTTAVATPKTRTFAA